MNLSPHFTLEEAVASDTARLHHIYNTPPQDVIETMKITALGMEMVRQIVGNRPVNISSWYRSRPLNAALGSKDTSQHILGEAVDFECAAFGPPVAICKAIINHPELVNFDQLILEHGWVHISFAILTGKPRRQVLSLLSNKSYAQGLTNPHGIPYK